MQATTADIPLTLMGLLDRAAVVNPHHEIVSFLPDGSAQRYTYRDFHRRVLTLARALVGAGLEKGSPVGTLMWNHHAHLEAHFGVPAAGGVLNSLNSRLHPTEIAYLIEHSETRVLLVDDTLWPLYRRIRNEIGRHEVLLFSYSGNPIPGGPEDYEAFLSRADVGVRLPEIGENDAASLCYTGGTTQRPKGVVSSHRALVLHSLVSGLPDVFGLCRDDVILPIIPMYHVNSSGLPFMAAMVGAKLVLPGSRVQSEAALDIFADEGVTFTAGVPTFWHGVLEALERSPGRWDLSPRLRVMVGGSAPSETLIGGLRRHGLSVIQTWGMTETAAASTVSRVTPDMERESEKVQVDRLAKQGVPVPLMQLRVAVDDQAQPWDGKTAGELQVRGPWVTGTYFRWPKSDEAFTEDGWLRTGDVVTIDPDACMTLVDRTKDLIRSGDDWISATALENALMEHPAVAEAAVIALPHEKWQERPLAAVVRHLDAKVGQEDLLAFLATRFAQWWLPDAIIFVEALPRTSVGKLNHARLREQFKGWSWTDPADQLNTG